MKTAIKIFTALLTIISFTINLQAEIRFSEKFGLTKGEAFVLPKSRQGISGVRQIKRISIKHGQYVEKMQVEWISKNGKYNFQSTGGGKSNRWSHFHLAEDEHIVYVKAASGVYITQLTFYTNKRRKFGPFGTASGKEFSFKLPKDARVIGFTGNSCQSISKLGVIYETKASNCFDKEEITRRRLAEIEKQRREEEARRKAASKKVTVRDHRTKTNPNVRDHRTNSRPIVRDHRTGKKAIVRDHRNSGSTKSASKEKSNITWDPQKAGG